MNPDPQVRLVLFCSARGLTAFFWTAMFAMIANWIAGIASFSPVANFLLRELFVIPLFCGLAVMHSAMAGMRESSAFGIFDVLSIALAGLSPFWGFWEMHPGTAYFAWNALALCALWPAWLAMACWLCRRYARDLGDARLAAEALVATVMVALCGVGTAGLVLLILFRNAMVLTPDAFLEVFCRVAGEARFLAAMPFLVAAYTLWLAKESGYRRLMAPPAP